MGLEEQIAEWRGFVGRRPAIAAEDVDEMEAHLRDQVADLGRAGLSDDEAFLVSVKRMGSLDALSREFAREHSERLWKQLVLGGSDAGPKGSRRDIVVMLGFAVAAAVVVRLALALLPDAWVLRNVPVLVLPFLGGYLAWTRRISRSVLLVLIGAVAAVALLLDLYPFDDAFDGGMTLPLAVAHAVVLVWFAVGVAYAGGAWCSDRRRMDFVRFTGEWVVYMALLALGGGALVGLAAAMFNAIGTDPETVLGEWVLPMGAAGATVVAAWLVEAKQSVIENMAPVLTRVFSPLTVLLLLAVLGAFVADGRLVHADRTLLIVTALVLVLVLGLWLFAVSAREPTAPVGLFDWILLVLLVCTLAVDAVVLAAMLSRITEFGASANKVTALGLNIVMLGNLIWSTRLAVGFLRGTRTFAELERWQTDYLPVYAAWAAFVVVAIPPIFGFA